MQPPWKRLFRTLLSHIPTVAPSIIARSLVVRANAERDARRFEAAAALYEEALKLAPHSANPHIQFGHMLKELGDYGAAERHYLKAADQRPEDAELALQFGHLYKLAGRQPESIGAYSRALTLRPGWTEAKEELARVGSTVGLQVATDKAPLPHLLPNSNIAREPLVYREGFHIRQMGAPRLRSEGGYGHALRGVEAIRGFLVATIALRDIAVLLDGRELSRSTLQTYKLQGAQTKYVFNIWADFSGVAPGAYTLELRATDESGSSRKHRMIVDVIAALSESELPNCDAVVDVDCNAALSIDEQIERRPSIVRNAARSIVRPSRILIQRADQLGDLVCSVPAIQRLRQHFPGAKFVGLVTAANGDLANKLGLFDDLVIVDFREEDGTFRKVMDAAHQQTLMKELQAHHFDVAIDLGETSASRPLLLLSGAPILCGFKDREFPWLTLGFELNSHDPANHHEMVAHERKLLALVDALAAMLTGGNADATYPLPLRSDPFEMTDPAPYVVIHTGARLAFSRWPEFPKLVKLIISQTNLTVVWMGEPPPSEFKMSSRIVTASGLMPFDKFDGLIAGAAIFIGNDSGPKHLAALRGVPAISLHTARLNWNEWGQTGNGLIISRRLPCAGCGISSAPEECGRDFSCVRGITAEEVFASLLQLMNRYAVKDLPTARAEEIDKA